MTLHLSTVENAQIIEVDYLPSHCVFLVLDKSRIYCKPLKTEEATRFLHLVKMPSSIRGLPVGDKVEFAALIDDEMDLDMGYSVWIFNISVGIKIARLRILNLGKILSVRCLSVNSTVCVASSTKVSFWKGSFPCFSMSPVVIKNPVVVLDLEDCFPQSTQADYFMNVSNHEVDVSLTKHVGTSDKRFLYTSFFFFFDSISKGYSHSINFETDSLVDECQTSPDGLFFVVHTQKKKVYLVETQYGTVVTPIHPALHLLF